MHLRSLTLLPDFFKFKSDYSNQYSLSGFRSKILLLTSFFLATHLVNSQTTVPFNSTGGSQNFTVPPCVTSIAVTINGGQGGGATGGLGASLTGNIPVTPGQVLQIVVGGSGTCPGTVYAGGGPSATQTYAPFQPCGGGGYSAIFSGGTPVVVAAGGGGTAGGDMGGSGGVGGCAAGGGGTSPFGQAGGGATQTSGGTGGPPWTPGGGAGTPGSYLQGGTGGNDLQYGNAAGGGGGGGYYGGGGGGSDNISGTSFVGGGGGGGGSSLVPAGFGCTMGGNAGAGQVVITYVATIPVITVNSAVICQGATAVLTASGGSAYTWSPGGMTGPSVSVSPGATTTYIVSSGSAGCVATATAQVLVNPAPVAFANSNSPVCLNTPINFVGSGGGTYSWSGPNGFSSTAQNPVIGSAQTIHGGTYSLLVTSAAGCTATATEFVTVNPLPVPVVNNPTVCINQTINLTASGGSTYSWSGPNGFSSTLQNPSITNASMAMAGTYNVIVTSAAGCTASAQANVTVLTLPNPSFTSNTPCVGATLLLNGSGGGTYSWTGPNGFISGLQNPSISNVTSAAGGVYSLVVTLGSCSNVFSAPVVINPSPVPTANSNSPVCLNTAINFNGGGGGTYSWSGPSGFTSTLQNPTIASALTSNAGVYTLTVTNSNGCTNTITTNVTVNPLPAVTVTQPIACLNQTIFLSANGGATYAWSGPGGFSSTLQNPTIPNATLPMAGAYNVLVTSAAGCTASAVSNVTVITLPNPQISNNTPCVGAVLTFTGSGGGSYNWTGPNGFASGAQNPTIPNVSMAANGTYSLIVTIGTCSNIISNAVTVNPLPLPTASNNGPVCANTSLNLTGGGGVSYTWTGPNGYTNTTQNPVIASAQSTNTGVYTLTVTNSNGCTNTITTNATVNPLPVITVNNPTVCVNQTINLTSTGGASYSWSGPNGYSSAAQNPVIINATTAMTGNYNVIVTTAQGCTASATSSVTVISLPTPSITSNTPCMGATLNLNGTGGSTYNWSGPNGFTSTNQNPSIANVSLAANGTYSLIVTVGTCSNIVSAPVVVNPLPVPTATSNSAVCANTAINFTGTGGTTYTWTGPSAYSSTVQNASINNAQFANAGTYTLTVTDSNGCINFTTTSVIVNALPIVPVTNPTVCVNQTINLSSNGGSTYSWSGPLGYTSTQQNPAITNATQNMSGSYTVTATSAAGCTMANVSNVLVLALPTPSITSNTPCVGATLFLGGSGGTTYSWSGPNGFSSTSQNPNISNVSMAANGTYSLLVSVGICTNNTTGLVIINPLPTPAITGNAAVCLNQPTTFNATGGVSYTWSGPNGFTGSGSSITISSANNLNTGSYVVTATDANNCSNTASAPLTVNPLPIIAAVGSTVCANQNITLSSSGGNIFLWNGPNGFTSGNQFPIISNALAAMAGDYSVTVTDVNGCTSTSITNVKVNPIPTPTATSNSPICANQTITLSSGAPTGVLYIWTGPGGFNANAQNLQIKPANVSQSGPYIVTVSDNIGCVASVTVNMVVNPLPSGVISSDKKEGCVPLCVSFTCQAATALQSCVWDFGTGGSSVGNVVTKCYEKDGPFYIKAIYTDINGCSNSSTYSVVAHPIPSADFNFAPQKPVEGEDVQFTNASYGPGTTFYWYFSNLKDSVIKDFSPTMIYQTQGAYAVALITVSDKGCRDTITKAVMVGEDYGLYVPNAFTPNGDGLNDVFFPKGFGIVKYELNIFDRWGERLFTTTKFEEGWPGNYTGRTEDIVPNGVYVWQIRLVNVMGKSKELTGKVTVTK